MIDSGLLGDIVTIKHDENISYWHFAHSYVRGNWRREEETSPMLLAKCCHDMDLLYWYTGSKFAKVNSYGGLKYFTEKSAPEGSAARCADCALRNTCIYDARYQYIGRPFRGKKFPWGTYAFCQSKSKADIAKSLEEGEKGRLFGRCVFRCDNDVVDHQVTNLLFDDGVTAQLTMTAFSASMTRVIKVHLTKGEIVGDMGTNTITFTPFGGKQEVIDVKSLTAGLEGHGGGDARLVDDFAALIGGKNAKILTDISKSLMSHQMCYAAEESRKNGGKTILL